MRDSQMEKQDNPKKSKEVSFVGGTKTPGGASERKSDVKSKKDQEEARDSAGRSSRMGKSEKDKSKLNVMPVPMGEDKSERSKKSDKKSKKNDDLDKSKRTDK